MTEPRPGRYRHYKGNDYEVIGIARQHSFERVAMNFHRRPDFPDAFAVGRVRQHLPDDFQIDGVRHAFSVPRP